MEPQKDYCKALFRLIPLEQEIRAESDENVDALRSMDSAGTRPVLFLFDRDVITLGRCRITQIRDLGLSRKQVRIEAKADLDYVEVTQLGKLQSSFINGQPLVYPWSRLLQVGDRLCLAEDNHGYRLERVDLSSGPNHCTPAPSRKRHITETFEVATASSTPMSGPRGRKSQKLSLEFTPQQLVDQLHKISAEKRKPMEKLLDSGKKKQKSAAKEKHSGAERKHEEDSRGVAKLVIARDEMETPAEA